MNILAIADKEPSQDMLSFLDGRRVDVVFLLGDLKASIFHPDGHWNIKKLSCPIMGVYGNHCKNNYITQLQGDEASGVPMQRLGSSIIGFHGCRHDGGMIDGDDRRGPFPLYVRHDEEVCLWSQIPRADIVLSHAPPFGVNDSIDDMGNYTSPYTIHTAQHQWSYMESCQDQLHVGWVGGRHYLHREKPSLWLHGHTYPSRHVHDRMIDDTRVCYVREARFITFSCAQISPLNPEPN